MPAIIQLSSGAQINLAAPIVNAIWPSDIVHALGNLCRFGGHCRQFYSVAQHSMLVASLLPRSLDGPLLRLAALLHDAAEAYVCDLPRPLKRLLPDYAAVERVMHEAIEARFDLQLSDKQRHEIRSADETALAIEARQLFNLREDPDWAGPMPADPPRIEPWGPGEAKLRFAGALAEALRATDRAIFAEALSLRWPWPARWSHAPRPVEERSP